MAAKKKKYKSKHLYKVIAKIACSPKCYDKQCADCRGAKWNTSNLVKFAQFLDKHHPNWRYFNVFKNLGKGLKGEQLDWFSTKKRPYQAKIRL